jgi:cysteinyl-tRNA synthetase
MHNNMVTVNGVKMGKSLGNFTTIKDVLKNFKSTVLRFFILQSHYRSTLDFSDSALQAAKAGWEKLQETYMRLQQAPEGKGTIELQKFEQQFCQAMNDDFNSPLAIATLFDLSREINSRLANEGLTKEAKETAIQFFNTYAHEVLGILSADTTSNETTALHDVLQKVMELVLEVRQGARARKDFTTSDLIRDRLKAAGVEVKDTKDGATWRLSR